MHPSSRAFDPPPFSTPADSAACREMIRAGSRSFHAASLLLPENVREAAYALYGFCRMSDDAVDVDGGRGDAVARLRARLDRIYAGDPAPGAVDRPLADAVARFAIPRATIDALLEGLQWDVEERTYETEADLEAYAARVAGSVGAMMAALMGARSSELVARACDLGVAMQYTNIARDVGEDARNGRLYLPRAWMREAGIDPDAWLKSPAFSPALAGVVARLLARANDLYRRADAGIARLPPAFRPAIHAARLLYAEIGAEVRRNGHDSIASRARVGMSKKLILVAEAVRRASIKRMLATDAPPLAGVRFLVDAVALERAPLPQHPTPKRRVEDDVLWVLDLFAALEQRTGQQAHSGAEA